LPQPHDANAEERNNTNPKEQRKSCNTGEVPSSPRDEMSDLMDAINAHALFRSTAFIHL